MDGRELPGQMCDVEAVLLVHFADESTNLRISAEWGRLVRGFGRLTVQWGQSGQ